ncbi:hypothetical protein TRFO_02120 [Tritrichomonas foetus]|uniref:Uncharacterized protein n=1 Tax=Tritrichomonas foetus TaxID=1144522 RepID=A0A1J4JAD9_9EUKA|nr:hypothetical protein TRFO_02120 [Tritrichomonas foetus]|eukprot:OHS95191.1 hypothetical protein TRFO_02120 [Tritrichomonas foetus]
MESHVSQLPLIGNDIMTFELRDNSEIPFDSLAVTINKFFCLFDIIPVAAWITVASIGSMANSIIHFLFMIFYTTFVNSSKLITNKKSKPPFIILLLSLIYSLLYIICETAIFFLTKSETIKSLPTVVKYFDIISYQDNENVPNVLFALIITLIIDIIYLPMSCLVSVQWYKRAKAATLQTLNRYILVLFMLSFSLAVSFSPHKYLLFMPAIFGFCCIIIGLFSRPFNSSLVMIFWYIFQICLFAFLVLISSDLILTIELVDIPKWARIFTTCITGFASSIYCGNNQRNFISPIRIVGQWKSPFIISGFAPFVVIISSLFFCLCQLSWASFVGLLAGIIPSFFSNKIMASAAPTTFVINVLVVVIQMVISIFFDKYSYDSKIALVLPFVLSAVSSLFLSNAKGAHFKTDEENNSILNDQQQNDKNFDEHLTESLIEPMNQNSSMHSDQQQSNESNDEQINIEQHQHLLNQSNLSKIQNVIGIILTIAFFTLSSLNATWYPVILTNVILIFSVLFALFGFFNKIAWSVLMMIMSLSAISQMIITLLLRFTSFDKIDQKLYNLFFIEIDPVTDPIYKSLWPVFVLFFIALLIKAIFIKPLPQIANFFSLLFIPILNFLPIITLENSVFTIVYLLLFNSLLFILYFSSHRSKVINGGFFLFFAVVHLVILLLYNFEFMRDFITNTRLRIILGLPSDGSIMYHTPGCLCLTLYIFFYCFSFKFGNASKTFTESQIYNFCKAFFSIFTFYFLMLAIFVAVLIDHTSSFIFMVILTVMGVVRIFTKNGQAVGYFLYIIYFLCFLFQLFCYISPISSDMESIISYIGPSVKTEVENMVNVIALLAAFSFAVLKSDDYEFPKLLVQIAYYIKRNILVIVQITLAITALEEDDVLAPISAIILLVLSLKKSIGKVMATFLNIIMILLILYVMFFTMMPLETESNITNYFLLNNVTNTDITHAFMHLFTCTLLLEFGVNEMPGFGNTIVTAYAFSFFSPIIMIVSFTIYDYMGMVHSIIFGSLMILVLLKWKYIFKFIVTTFLYTIIIIFIMTIRHMPWFSQANEIIDKLFVMNGKYTAKWIVIFTFEFFLVAMTRNEEFKEVQARESQRCSFRKSRQKIFAKIREKDEEFLQLYFMNEIYKLQSDFKVLAVQGSYAPYPATEADYKRLEGEDPDATDIETQTTENLSTTAKVLRAISKFFKAVFHYLVDFVVKHMMLLSDYNLEPGISLPGVEKINAFYDVMLEQFKQNRSLDIPEEWLEFANSIPYSLRHHFRLISRLSIHHDRKIRRFQLLRRYSSLLLRSIFPILLIFMALFYPFVQSSSIVSFAWIMFVFISVSLKIHTYKHYFLFALIILLIRYIVQLPYIDEMLYKMSISVSEQQRNIPILSILGLSNLSKVFTYDSFLLLFSVFSTAQIIQHPATYNKRKANSFFARITQYSPYRVNLPVFIFIVDFIGFLILLLFYGSWSTYGTNIMSMVSGSSSVSPLYVFLLMFMMCFMLMIHIFYLSKNAKLYFFVGILYAFCSFTVTFFVIPSISKKQCWQHSSFHLFVFLRLIAQLLISCQLNLGFPHEPPQISKKKPLFTMVYEIVVRACPFLFEIMVCMKWIANKTSVSLFNTFILQFIKSKLKGQRASYMISPPRKAKGHAVGILFLILMIFLLFVPLLLLSTSDSTTILNPATIVESHFGIAGLTNFYENLITVENSKISSSQQTEISELNDTTLLTFYSMSSSQIQILDLPFGSMNEFDITPDAKSSAIDQLSQNESTFIPFGTISLSFKTATTKNKVQNVVLNLFANKLTEEQKINLTSALLSNYSSETVVEIPNFLPMFVYIPYDSVSGQIDHYYYDATFKKFSDGVTTSWQLITTPSASLTSKIPNFLNVSSQNTTRIVVWSQPTPDQYIGSLISSTGGIIGLYAFIVVTIGQFITMWIAGLFTDLWISRMHNPLKLLNALMAIEAYQLSGDLDKEFELAELVLENMRSTTRIIQLTDIANSNINPSQENLLLLEQTNFEP